MRAHGGRVNGNDGYLLCCTFGLARTYLAWESHLCSHGFSQRIEGIAFLDKKCFSRFAG